MRFRRPCSAPLNRCFEMADSRPPARKRSPHISQLDAIFQPRSIAVVGASRRRFQIGHEIVRNLVEGGFTGPVYPVNPSAPVVHSMHCFKRVRDIPGRVDLAVLVVPAVHVLAAARDCARCLGVLHRQCVERGEVRGARCGRAGRPGRDGGTVRRARGTPARCAARRSPRHHARPRPRGYDPHPGHPGRAQPANRPDARSPGSQAALQGAPARQSGQGDAQHSLQRRRRRSALGEPAASWRKRTTPREARPCRGQRRTGGAPDRRNGAGPAAHPKHE